MAENILIVGGSGTVGQELSKLLLSKGYEVSWLGRSGRSSMKDVNAYKWDIKEGYIEEGAIEKADHIIHLAGANIAESKWTDERKRVILESRTHSTRLLGEKIKKRDNGRLKSLICASAIGFYDQSPEGSREEDSPRGEGFMADVCDAWEKEIDAIKLRESVRRSTFRIGIVLSKEGGALEKMAAPVKFFVGAPLGSGKQHISWIHILDLCRMLLMAVEDEEIQGVLNAVAPSPATNAEFTKALGKVLKRPTFWPNVPEFVLNTLLDEMATMVLGGAKVSSRKIQKMGFLFKFNSLEAALADLLK